MHRRSRPGNPHLRPFPATLRLLVPGPRFENRGGRMAPQRPLRGVGSRCPQGHREVCRRRAVAFGTPRCQASSAGWRRCGKARSPVLGAPTAANGYSDRAGGRRPRCQGPWEGRRVTGPRTSAPRTSHGAASVCGGTSWAAGRKPTCVHTAGRGCTGRAGGNLDSARQKAQDRRTLACRENLALPRQF